MHADYTVHSFSLLKLNVSSPSACVRNKEMCQDINFIFVYPSVPWESKQWFCCRPLAHSLSHCYHVMSDYSVWIKKKAFYIDIRTYKTIRNTFSLLQHKYTFNLFCFHRKTTTNTRSEGPEHPCDFSLRVSHHCHRNCCSICGNYLQK